MAPVPVKVLHRRGDNAGRTFSIIFAVIALLVVLTCLIWGIILPRYRKRGIRRPGRVAANRAAISNPRQFPSHPALLHGFQHKSSIALRQYNPRTESPFPSPRARSTVDQSIPSPFPPPARLLGAPTHSNGLFTPDKGCSPSRRGRSRRYIRFFQPKASTENEGQDIMSRVNAGQDYVLPIPGALVLKPRPAGRPPPLTKQLGMLPLPKGDVKRQRGLVHAVKLDQDLERRDSKSTADTLGTPCPMPCHAGGPSAGRSTVLRVAVRDESPTAEDANQAQLMSSQSISPSHVNPPLFPHDPNGKSVEERGSIVPAVYGLGKQLSSGKAGTWTRPTTPPSEHCVLRDRTITDEKTNSASSSRGYTPSTNPFTTPGLSSTPLTSSIVSSNTVPVSSTPARAVAPPAKLATTSHGLLDEAAPHTKQSAYPTHALSLHPRVAGSNVATSCDLQPQPAFMQRHSISSLSTIVKPIMITARSNLCPRASSIYSRDTKGMSFRELSSHAQTTPDTAEVMMHPWLSIANRLDPFQQDNDMTDVPKSKIDEPDMHTVHFDASLLPSYPLKRSISDFGPRSMGLHSSPSTQNCNNAGKRDSNDQGRSIPAVCSGQLGDSVFSKDVRNIRWARAAHARAMSQRNRPEPTHVGAIGTGTAPGGGQWI